MANCNEKNHNSPGGRVSKVRKQHNWTQEQLATAMGVEPNYISMLETGSRKLPVKRAKEIASLFPPLRYQFLLCEDDFETDADLFDALIDEHRERYEKRISTFKNLATFRGFDIALYSSGSVIGPSGGYEDIYLVRRGDKQVYASYSEIIEWVEDLCDLAELKLNRMLNKKGGSDNG